MRFLARATAPHRAVLDPSGGVTHAPASGAAEVLQPGEIARLAQLSREVSRFPSLRDETGGVLPADIEFAFRGGKLALLQIRPFVESKSAQRNLYLAGLDAGSRERGSTPVPLDAVPAAGG